MKWIFWRRQGLRCRRVLRIFQRFFFYTATSSQNQRESEINLHRLAEKQLDSLTAIRSGVHVTLRLLKASIEPATHVRGKRESVHVYLCVLVGVGGCHSGLVSEPLVNDLQGEMERGPVESGPAQSYHQQ